MKSILLEHWSGRSRQEKIFLMIIAAIFTALVVYAFLWMPASKGRAKLMAELPEKEARLQRMKQQANEIESQRKNYQLLKSNTAQLKTMIQASAKIHGIMLETPPAQNQPDKNTAAVTIKAVNFNTWATWINTLQSEKNIRVNACFITSAGKPGEVKIEADFTAGESL